MEWTDDRTDMLKRLVAKGHSAGEIVRLLGGVTRNAVIAKTHRLGLTLGAGRNNGANIQRRRVTQASRFGIPVGVPKSARPMPKPVGRQGMSATARAKFGVPGGEAKEPVKLPTRIEEPGSATVLTLGAHMCRWPIGDPSSDSFTFCGRRKAETGSYCPEHAQVAYQQPQEGKKKASASELARSLRKYI